MYATYKKHRLAIFFIIAAVLILSATIICGAQGTAYAANGVAEVRLEDGTLVGEYTDIAEAWSAADIAGAATVTLLADVETTDTLTVADGKNITLDLNGKKLQYDYNHTPNSVITVSGNFTLKDLQGGGEITGGYADVCGGGVRIDDGNFTMESGTITGNNGASMGGGVFVGSDGTFKMQGGTINNNTASWSGGGVCILGKFEVSGAVNITGNTVDGVNNVYLYEGAIITVDGALVDEDGNRAQIGVTLSDDYTGAFTQHYGDKCKDTDGNVINPSKYFVSDNANYVPVLDNGEVKLAEGKVTVQIGNNITAYETVGSAFDFVNNASATATVTLFADQTTTEALAVYVDSVITLDLNGKMLKLADGSEQNSVIEVYGNFTLTDGEKDLPQKDKTPHKYSVSTDGETKGLWVFDEDEGTEILYGGVITGGNNDLYGGGGVYVDALGTFIMESGTISGNYARTLGGGVYVNGKFTMNGGVICGNKAMAYGGGVYVAGNGTFEISGAVNITGNHRTNNSNDNVYLNSGKTITVACSLEDNDGKKAQIGVTLNNYSGAFTQHYGEKCKDTDGNVINPSKYFIPDRSGYHIYLHDGEVMIIAGDVTVQIGNDITACDGILDAWSAANNESTATVTLFADQTTMGTIIVANYKNITLDLNGKMLKLADGSAQNSVIKVNGNFTLTDSEKDLPQEDKTPHEYYVSTEEGKEGLWVFDEDNGTEILYGGVIAGGNAGYGGGVDVNGGEFTMESGNICGNYAIYGGGVYINGGEFTMESGNICGNYANYAGGGVNVGGGEFTMEGGNICKNHASVYGGGVYVNGGTFTMNSGNISGNYAQAYGGGGVHVFNGMFNISGTPVIKGNTLNVSANDVDLVDVTITVIGKLENGAQIYVYNTGAVATGFTAANGMGGKDPSDYFIPDDETNNCIYVSDPTNGEVTIGTHDWGTEWTYDEANHWHACQNCGEKKDEGGHQVEDEWHFDETYHWHECSICGRKSDKGEHDGEDDGDITTALYCEVCGYVITPAMTAEVKFDGNTTYYPTVNEAFTYANGLSTDENNFAEIKLLTNVTTDNVLTVNSGKYITLDLNGYVVQVLGGGKFIIVNGDFTLEDSAEGKVEHSYQIDDSGLWVFVDGDDEGLPTVNGGVITGCDSNTNGGCVYINEGTFTMKGGYISGNKSNGGAIYVYNSTFIMTGGHINGNVSSGNGGGVHVGYGSTFTMENGEICYNAAKGQGQDGGGVYMRGNSFSMSGGILSNNVAARNGGGVYLYNNNFAISGAPIINNNELTDGSANNVYSDNNSTITVAGKLEKDGKKAQIGVYNTGAVATGFTAANGMGGKDPSDYFFPDDPENDCIYISDSTNGEVTIGTHDWGTEWTYDEANHWHACQNCGEKQDKDGHRWSFDDDVTTAELCEVCKRIMEPAMTTQVKFDGNTTYYPTVNEAFNYANSLATDENKVAEIKLLVNVTVSNTLQIYEGKYVTLDLNGFILKYNGSSGSGFIHVFGNFTLKDGNQTAKHDYYVDEANGGIWVFVDEDFNDETKTLHEIEGGVITGGNSENGGAVYVDGGTFTMESGNICGNLGVYGGGGVCVYGGGTFIMESGKICGNSANGGGGVIVDGGTFTMNGGEITENRAIFYEEDGSYYYCGGGVCVYGGKFEISNAPIINENYAVNVDNADETAENNVSLNVDTKITVADKLEKDGKKAQIGVTYFNGNYGSFTSGYSVKCKDTSGTIIDPSEYFFDDTGAAGAVLNGDGEAAIGSYVAEVTGSGTVKEFVTIDEAFVYANGLNGETEIKLIANTVVMGDALYVAEEKNITLDLNGYMLRFFKVAAEMNSDCGLFVGGTFTLEDGSPYAEHEYFIVTLSDGVTTITMWFFVDGEDEKDYINAQGATYEEKTLCGGVIANAGGVWIDGGNFTMNGGTISGIQGGSGVHVDGGNFTMNDGSICGNLSMGYAGGVYVDGGNFTMNDGSIYGNTGMGAAGGVTVNRGGSFTMNGGKITENVSYGSAGGVLVKGVLYNADDEVIARGTFIMTGGEISNNTAYYGASGGVYVAEDDWGERAVFEISGAPVIKGNHLTDGVESNVYLAESCTITVVGKLEDEDGKRAQIGIFNEDVVLTAGYGTNNKNTNGNIINPGRYFIPDQEGYVAVLEDGEVKLAEGNVTVQIGDEITAHETVASAFAVANSATAPATVTLFADQTTTDTLTVDSESVITLDLNGYILKFGYDAVYLTIQGTFTLIDSNPTSEHKYYVKSDGRWLFDETDGTETLEGGIITSAESNEGGGVKVTDGGTFEMTGGSICGNNSIYGGGVYIGGGTFKMTGGNICGNTSSYGGGVYVDDGTFEMSGGNITDNTAIGGGGVDINSGTFKMTGGSITDNTAGYGGGMLVVDGTFEISGTPVITGNNSNIVLLLPTITVVGELEEGAIIGINNTDVVATDYTQNDKPSKFFIPDNDEYDCVYVDGGTVYIGTHDFNNAPWVSDGDNHWHECQNGCGEKSDVTAHNYNKEVATETYLKTLATCEEQAVYYKSCVCGAHGTDTFEDGELADHTHGEAVRENVVDSTCSENGSMTRWFIAPFAARN